MGRIDPRLSERLLESLECGIMVFELAEPRDDASLGLLYANGRASELGGVGELAPGDRPRIRDVLPWLPVDRVRMFAEVARGSVAADRSILSPALEGACVTLSLRALGIGDRMVLVSVTRLGDDGLEAEARRAVQSLDSIIEQLPAMIFLKDAKNLRFERFNRAGEELLGLSRDALLGRSDHDFFPQEQADFFVSKDREVLSKKSLHDIPEEPIETPRGTRWLHTRKIPLLDEHGEPRHLLGISLDITERKRAEELLKSANDELARRVEERTKELHRQVDETLRAREALARTEEQLRHSQKMEAIGRLAGGVAHDFNNMLSVVLGYSDLVLAQAPEGSTRIMIEEIRKAGARAAQLTGQLLAFGRQQVLRPRVFDLNTVVTGTEGMLSRLVGEDIELCIRVAHAPARVKADSNQIEQVIMNLVVNARDAMPTGGKLTIETDKVHLDARYAAEHFGAGTGPHVLLAVSDTGIGMDKETIARIFEPFFTTKETGRGTGLGLSTVLGIVQQSGGSIWVYSEIGKGSTFKVYLPFIDEAITDVRVSSAPSPALHGNETVLLVEDDAQVRALAADVLRRHGFEVLEAQDATSALRIGCDFGCAVDLLITDVVMPEMGGRALAQRLLEVRPNLRVLFMSGYTDDAVVRHGVLEAGLAFLQKPLTPVSLLRAVRGVIDGTL